MKLLKSIGVGLFSIALAFGLYGCGSTGTLIAKDDLTSEFLGKITTAFTDTITRTNIETGTANGDFSMNATNSIRVFTDYNSSLSITSSITTKQSGKDADLKRFVQSEGRMNSESANGKASSNVMYKIYLGKSGEKFYAIEQVGQKFGEYEAMGEAQARFGEFLESVSYQPELNFTMFEGIDKDTELQVFNLGGEEQESLRVVLNVTTLLGSALEVENETDATDKEVISATLILNKIGEGEDAKLLITSFEVSTSQYERETTDDEWELDMETKMNFSISYGTQTITLPDTTDYKDITIS